MSLIEGNKSNFEKLIKEGKVLVDFNAEWCGPCKMLKPVIEEIAQERSNIKIISINIDDEEELADRYNVMSIPCLVLFENGEEVKRSVGFKPKSEVESFIGEYCTILLL